MACDRTINRLLARLAGRPLSLGSHTTMAAVYSPSEVDPWWLAKRAWVEGRRWARGQQQNAGHETPQVVALAAAAFRWLAGDPAGSAASRQSFSRDFGLANAFAALYQGPEPPHHCARCGAFVGPNGVCMRQGCGGADEGADSPGARWGRDFCLALLNAARAYIGGRTPGVPLTTLATMWETRPAAPRQVRRRPGPAEGRRGAAEELPLPATPAGLDAAAEQRAERALWDLLASGAVAAPYCQRGLAANLPADLGQEMGCPPLVETEPTPAETAVIMAGEYSEAALVAQGRFERGERLSEADVRLAWVGAMGRVGWGLRQIRRGDWSAPSLLSAWSVALTLTLVARARRVAVPKAAHLARLSRQVAEAIRAQQYHYPRQAQVYNPAAPADRGLPDTPGHYNLPEVPPAPPAAPEVYVALPEDTPPVREQQWRAAGFHTPMEPNYSEAALDTQVTLGLGATASGDTDLNRGLEDTLASRYQRLGPLAVPVVSAPFTSVLATAGGFLEVPVPPAPQPGLAPDRPYWTVPAQTPFADDYFAWGRTALHGPTYRLLVWGEEIIFAQAQSTAAATWEGQNRIPAPAARLARAGLQALGWDTGVIEVVHHADGRWYVRDADCEMSTVPALGLATLRRAIQRALLSGLGGGE